MRIKVVYLIGTLEVGGSERQLVQLATGLDREKFESVVCCLSSGGPLERELAAQGIPVTVIGLRNRRDIRRSIGGLLRLLSFMRRQRPQIVHGFLFWAYVFGAFCGRLTRVPVVIGSRRSLGNYKAEKPHYLALERIANRMTDLVIANSEAVRRDVLRQEHLAPDKVIVVHNGVLVRPVDGTRRLAARRSIGFTDDALLVGVLANLIQYKGHTVFLQAWSSVVVRVPSAVALLIGDGPMRLELERLVDELGLGASVKFLGSRSDVSDLLCALDLLVHPSLQEGFSNAILEAMAAGVPVVATAVGGNVEAVVDGVTGTVVAPGDAGPLAAAIDHLLNDPTARATLGAAGRRRVAELYDVSAVVRRYEDVYTQLVRRRGRVGRAASAVETESLD